MHSHRFRRPTYAKMQIAYNDYRANPQPCRRPLPNQCAIRMSIALVRNGLGFANYTPHRLVHNNQQRCGTPHEHIAGASSLANYLGRVWTSPKTFSGEQLQDALSLLTGKRGIIYFNDCFGRRGQAAQLGDHIDLWTGTQYFNQIIHTRVGGNAGANASLFSRADKIQFWQLP